MKKALFVASVIEHFISFHQPYMKWFHEQGYEVHATALDDTAHPLKYCDKFIEIPFCRSPFTLKNIRVYKQLKTLLEKGGYDIVHCHTPMAAALTRLAARALRKKGLKVIYTAHGFHFFKGAPLAGWMLYYPVEKWLAKYTDAIITINHEDYENVIKHKFKCGNSYLVPGVGVNSDSVIVSTSAIKATIRRELGYRDDDFILFYAAEFIPRKNHRLIIEQLPSLITAIPNIKLVLAGRGSHIEEIKALAEKLDVLQYVDFLGYRRDIPKLVAMSDVGVSSSLQEGLPISVVENMFGGLPVVVSIERGHRELVVDGLNGFLFDLNKPNEFSEKILKLYNDPALREKMGQAARVSIQKFSVDNALKEHIKIYKAFL